MRMFVLAVLPFLAIAPGIFNNQSGTPKVLVVAIGLYLYAFNGVRASTAAHRQIITFLLVCLASWFFAQNRWLGFSGSPRAQYYGLVQVALIALAYSVGNDLEDDLSDWLVCIGALLGAFCILQYAMGKSFCGVPLQNGRACGLRFSPVMMAASLLPCGIICWNKIRSMYPCPRIEEVTLFLMIVSGMFATQSKGAILALSVGVWVYETKGALRWAGVATLLCLLALYECKVNTPTNLERIELLKIAWISFKQHPILGWGPDNFLVAMLQNVTPRYIEIVGGTRQASAHQDIAQVASTLGIAGLAAYVWLMWSLIKSSGQRLTMALLVCCWFQAQVNPIPVDILCLFAVLIGQGHLTEDRFELPSYCVAILLCLVVAIATLDLTPQVLIKLFY